MQILFFVTTNNDLRLGSGQGWAGAVIVDRSRRADGEVRQAAIGLLHGRICTLVFTDRPDDVRLISFRRSNRSEEKVCEKIRPGPAQSPR